MHNGKKESRVKVLLEVEVPESCPEEYKKPSAEEKVKYALDRIDSGYESRKEWEFIRLLNNMLMKKDKLTERAKNILDLIQPTIEKYGEYDHKGVCQDSEKKAEIKEKK